MPITARSHNQKTGSTWDYPRRLRFPHQDESSSTHGPLRGERAKIPQPNQAAQTGWTGSEISRADLDGGDPLTDLNIWRVWGHCQGAWERVEGEQEEEEQRRGLLPVVPPIGASDPLGRKKLKPGQGLRFEAERESSRDGIRLGHCSQQDAVSGRVCIGGEVKAKGYFHVAAAAAARHDHDHARDHNLARPSNKGPASQPAAAVVELHQDEPSADSWPLQAATQSPQPGRTEQPQPQVQVQFQFQVQVQVQGSGLRRGIDESGQLAVARPPLTRVPLACLVTSCPVRPVCTDTRRPTTPRQCNHCQPLPPESQPQWSQRQAR